MEKLAQKKSWMRPELIVIVRSHPAEAVLAGCKQTKGGATGPNYYVSDCGQEAISCTGSCTDMKFS